MLAITAAVCHRCLSTVPAALLSPPPAGRALASQRPSTYPISSPPRQCSLTPRPVCTTIHSNDVDAAACASGAFAAMENAGSGKALSFHCPLTGLSLPFTVLSTALFAQPAGRRGATALVGGAAAGPAGRWMRSTPVGTHPQSPVGQTRNVCSTRLRSSSLIGMLRVCVCVSGGGAMHISPAQAARNAGRVTKRPAILYPIGQLLFEGVTASSPADSG